MKQKVRHVSIRVKLLTPVCVVILAICCVLGIYSISSYKSGLYDMAKKQAQDTAEIVVGLLNPEKVLQVTKNGEQTEDYIEQRDIMREVQDNSSIKYVYTLYTDGKNVYYGIDADREDAGRPGEEFILGYKELKQAFDGEIYVEPEIDTSEGEALATVYVPFYSDDKVAGILGCDYDVSDIMNQINEKISLISVFSIVSFVVAVILVLVTVQVIVNNLKKVNVKLYDLVNSEGDLTKKLDIRSADELELIAGNVNSLLEYIRGIMLKISGDSVKLNESSKTMVNKITHVESGMTSVTETMEDMSASMEETSAALIGINDSIVRIVDEINLMSQRAERGRKSSDDIRSRAGQVHEDAVFERDQARVMAEAIKKAVNDKIEKSKAVETINKLTDEIINITNQTNLLSLNASIEAARAGESGRGFAVVAERIGQLAIDSANAASQIQHVSEQVIKAVDELATESENMINFMDETAMRGYEVLLKTSDDYQNDAGFMNESMGEFASSSISLKQNIDSIRDSVASVNIAVERNAEGITTVTEATVNAAFSVEDIGKESASNLQIANNLDAEVSRFKLE